MSGINKYETSQTEKLLGDKQSPIKSVDRPPPKSDMANWNDFSLGLDETNGKLYIHGKKKNFVITLTEY